MRDIIDTVDDVDQTISVDGGMPPRVVHVEDIISSNVDGNDLTIDTISAGKLVLSNKWQHKTRKLYSKIVDIQDRILRKVRQAGYVTQCFIDESDKMTMIILSPDGNIYALNGGCARKLGYYGDATTIQLGLTVTAVTDDAITTFKFDAESEAEEVLGYIQSTGQALFDVESANASIVDTVNVGSKSGPQAMLAVFDGLLLLNENGRVRVMGREGNVTAMLVGSGDTVVFVDEYSGDVLVVVSSSVYASHLLDYFV